MFETLQDINRRPEPFGAYTARELWTDPHVAHRMLAFHLDPTVDAASRNHAFIDRSVRWIIDHFGLTPGSSVADFGCGPGLYAHRFARAGLDVTGIDFSLHSLEYARSQAAEAGLIIDYVHADYLGFETHRRFDLIVMIMCDFCALSPGQRADLLGRFRSLLAPGGSVLLDVYSPAFFEHIQEKAVYAADLMDGFWSTEPYYGFLNTFKYETEQLVLDQYTLVERDRKHRIYNWYQCFTPASIRAEFEAAGLEVTNLWSDVAGNPYRPESSEFAVAARVQGIKEFKG